MSRSFRWALLLSGALKLLLAIVFADIPPRYDETEFLAFGTAIAENGAGAVLWRAPGYQWFVAIGMLVAGGNAVGVRLLQVALSVTTSFLVYRIGNRLRGERAGLLAGSFVAFYPSHVAFSHLLWSETLYTFLLVLALERLLAADRTSSLPAAAVAGAALGIATLTRSVGLAVGVVSVAWILLPGRDPRRIRLAATAAVAAVLVSLPWSVNASLQAGRPTLVDTNSGFNLWSGNNEYIPADLQGLWCVGLPLQNGVTLPLPDDGWKGRVGYLIAGEGITDSQGPDGDAWFRARAVEEIRRRPLGMLRRAPRKLAALWAPDFFLPRHLVRDWYGPTPPALAAVLTLLTLLAAAIPMIVGPAALGLLRRSRFRSLALLWIGAYLLAHALVYGHSRMHQPLVPLLVLAVAILVADPPVDWRTVIRRGAPWSAIALVLWVVGWPIVGGLYLMPGPRHVGLARVVAVGRHAPLPGSERLAWMLAGVEAARGNEDEARRILSRGRWSDLPWTLYLRGRLEADPERGARWLERAVAKDPDLFAGWLALAAIRARSGDRSGAERCLREASRIRPWDARIQPRGRDQD